MRLVIAFSLHVSNSRIKLPGLDFWCRIKMLSQKFHVPQAWCTNWTNPDYKINFICLVLMCKVFLCWSWWFTSASFFAISLCFFVVNIFGRCLNFDSLELLCQTNKFENHQRYLQQHQIFQNCFLLKSKNRFTL